MPQPDATPDLDDADDVAQSIRRAEAAIANLRQQFVEWVRRDLATMDMHLQRADAAVSPDERLAALEDLRRIAHNIKGQGGTFGFVELTNKAAALDAAIKSSGPVLSVNLVKSLLDDLRAAFDGSGA